MVAVGYIRRSKAADAKVVSLDVQRAAVAEYCTAHGWHLAAVVEHDGVSGTRRERFTALNANVATHSASVVVVYSLDRAARDVAGLLDWMKAQGKHGVAVHLVGRGEIETKTVHGFINVTVEAMMAEAYARQCGEKTAAALQHLKAQGKRWGCDAPYGITWQDGRAVPNEDEQAVLATVRALRAQGYKLRAISAHLANKGITNRQGRTFHTQTIARMLCHA